MDNVQYGIRPVLLIIVPLMTMPTTLTPTAFVLYCSNILEQKLRIILGVFSLFSFNSFVPLGPWSTNPTSTQPNSLDTYLNTRSACSAETCRSILVTDPMSLLKFLFSPEALLPDALHKRVFQLMSMNTVAKLTSQRLYYLIFSKL